MNILVLVVDDEPDVEALFRQQFRRDLRAQRFVMDFANSAADALARIACTIEQSLILILSDINMPGMTGLEMLPKVKEMRPDVPVIMITAYGDPETKRKAMEGGATRAADQADRLHPAPGRNRYAAGAGGLKRAHKLLGPALKRFSVARQVHATSGLRARLVFGNQSIEIDELRIVLLRGRRGAPRCHEGASVSATRRCVEMVHMRDAAALRAAAFWVARPAQKPALCAPRCPPARATDGRV